jgi:hypothetical protein
LDAKMMSPRPNAFVKCCKAIIPFMKKFVLVMPSDGSHDYFQYGSSPIAPPLSTSSVSIS